MTDIVCKCGVSRLEDVQCAECGEYFKAVWIPVEPDTWTFCPYPCEIRYGADGKPTHYRRVAE